MDSLDVENVPLVNLLDTILTQYNENLRSLLGQLDTEGNRNTNQNATRSRIDTAQKLVKLDQSLQQLFIELTHHQRRQEEIRSTQQLSIESGKAKLKFINSMLDAKSELEEAIADSEKKLKLAHVAEAASPSVSDIIDYAKKLSKFSTAPPNFNPGSGVPPEPPYPVLLALQGGSLSRYRMQKASKVDNAANEDNDEGDYGHGMDDDQFDDMDADDLLLSLDLNPDL
ncbi:hypothetical protein GGI15_003193 [Coemansia interrupta]|uniref:Mediator of RNA polymerase II transcription subunit 4 n=1 Tax=Coemansia interrupta TaxID=1126814 RepID=A0A9W8HAN5_9FUNG|nr:hypothetical protein GGI15_003193 [Coemansia interrupta]